MLAAEKTAAIKRLDADILKIADAIMRMCKVIDLTADQIKLHEEALVKAGLLGEP